MLVPPTQFPSTGSSDGVPQQRSVFGSGERRAATMDSLNVSFKTTDSSHTIAQGSLSPDSGSIEKPECPVAVEKVTTTELMREIEKLRRENDTLRRRASLDDATPPAARRDSGEGARTERHGSGSTGGRTSSSSMLLSRPPSGLMPALDQQHDPDATLALLPQAAAAAAVAAAAEAEAAAADGEGD
eukprot:Rhum_TRINITY_DN12710_c2_g1::Rhum_TRINITY_DN12710_c2_g1_i1::g.53896::m.53896